MRGLTPGTPCADCGRPLRPARHTKAEHPGTVAHGGDGLCKGCQATIRRNENRAAVAVGPDFRSVDDLPGLDHDDPKVRHDARALRDYMKGRRR